MRVMLLELVWCISNSGTSCYDRTFQNGQRISLAFIFHTRNPQSNEFKIPCTLQCYLIIKWRKQYNERAVYPHILISRVTPRSHNQDPEYSLLTEQNPVLRNPQQTLLFCTFFRPPVLQDVH